LLFGVTRHILHLGKGFFDENNNEKQLKCTHITLITLNGFIFVSGKKISIEYSGKYASLRAHAT
jgi:hypothetical protein